MFHSQACQFAHCASQSEKRLIAILEGILGESAMPQYTFTWFISSHKRHMHLDAYFPTANLAVEYDGRHHREYMPLYHRTPEAFVHSQQRDSLKNRLLESHGIPLLRVTDKEPLTVEYVMERLSDIQR